MNYLAILTASVLAMVVGAIWYGPLFGKKWMEIIGADAKDKKARKKMQKSAGPLYLIQFLLTLFQVFVLLQIINVWKVASETEWTATGALETAVWIWAGFVIPTVAGAAMWNNDPKNVKWARFLIQGGYQLVIFAIFGLTLGFWT